MGGTDVRDGPRVALELATIAAECRTIADVQGELMPAVARAFSATLVLYHQILLGERLQEYVVPWPADLMVGDALAAYPEVARHAPLRRHFAAHPQEEVAALSELVSPAAWHENPLFRDCFRALRVEDHLAAMIAVTGDVAHGFTLTRERRPFGPGDRALASLLRAHLRAAVRRSLEGGAPYEVWETFPAPRATLVTGPALPAAGGNPLTLREREVLSLVATGLDNRRTARRLGIAHRTVDKHLENVLAKLGASSRTEAVALARERARAF
jgi:DNA-binding CsgD family transcriptional regulator